MRRGLVALGLATALLPVAASEAAPGDITLSGRVLGTNNLPVQGSGVVACEGSNVPITMGCPFVLADAAGNYTLPLDSDDAPYTAAAFANSGNTLSDVALVSVDAVQTSHFVLPVPGSATGDRIVTATVLGSGGVVLGAGTGLSFCPGTAWIVNCPGGFVALANPATGVVTAGVAINTPFAVLPFAYGGSVTGSVFTIGGGENPTTIELPFVLEAGPARIVSGRVLDGLGETIPHVPSATQVWLCRASAGSTGSCPGRITRFTEADGSFSAVVDSTVDYTIQGVSYALLPRTEVPGGVRSRPQVIAAAPDGIAGMDIELEFGEVEGTVTRTGWTEFPTHVIGVGACPTDIPPEEQTGAGVNCFGLQAVFAGADGTYRFPLPPGSYNVSGYMYVDGVLVIGQSRPMTVTWDDSTGGSEALGEAFDANAVGSQSSSGEALVLAAPEPGRGTITVHARGLPVSNALALPADDFLGEPTPDLAWGAMSFTVDVPEPVNGEGVTIEVDLTFQNPLPDTPVFHKYVAAEDLGEPGTWEPYDNFVIVDVHHATLTLTDGGAGDYDGVANGWITDPLFGEVEASDYDLTAFDRPLRPGPNLVKGKNLPIKWRVTAGGTGVDDPASFGSLVANVCGEPVVIATADTIRYVGDGWWQFDWKPSPAIRTCATGITLTLADGDSASAQVQFR